MKLSRSIGLGVVLIVVASAAALRLSSPVRLSCEVSTAASPALDDDARPATRSLWIDVDGATGASGSVRIVRTVRAEPRSDNAGAAMEIRAGRGFSRVHCAAGAAERIEMQVAAPGRLPVVHLAADGAVDVVLHRGGVPLAATRLPAAGRDTATLRW